MISLQYALFIAVTIFSILSLTLIVQHERHQKSIITTAGTSTGNIKLLRGQIDNSNINNIININNNLNEQDKLKLANDAALANEIARKEERLEEIKNENIVREKKKNYLEKIKISETKQPIIEEELNHKINDIKHAIPIKDVPKNLLNIVTTPSKSVVETIIHNNNNNNNSSRWNKGTVGNLMCDGKDLKSEIIYWKDVPGDSTYESPITPHHGVHDDRYLTFEYDQGGWNNVRMVLECMLVIAHAMGRTLVVPPQQHLYLLGKTHKDKEDVEAHDEMGFEDFFDLDLLKSHKGFHMMHMEEFLEKEGVTGSLKGRVPPNNESDIWGPKLWHYLDVVADASPEWTGKFLAFPDKPGDFNMTGIYGQHTISRIKAFGGERHAVYYTEELQQAHHIHFPADGMHRLLQHHYAFTFFANSEMQSFYKRFVRDYMRYKDNIQCAGAELVAAVRKDSLAINPNGN
jgi:hypothetical protein